LNLPARQRSSSVRTPDKIKRMTQLDVEYRYGASPPEAAVRALSRIREVYGIRGVAVAEAEKTVRVEYDATRLTEAIVHQLLRRSGLDIVERVALTSPLPEPAAAPAA
jgi:hypothetical protein